MKNIMYDHKKEMRVILILVEIDYEILESERKFIRKRLHIGPGFLRLQAIFTY